MLAMVLPSGALPAPLVVEAACSGPSTIALTAFCIAGMARSYATNRPILWKIIASRRAAGVSIDNDHGPRAQHTDSSDTIPAVVR